MSEMTGSSGRRSMTDREIAEDLLAGQKYLSNYYYAPAILEAGDPGLRSAFQEVHADATTAAKSVFDYLHSKGWYQVRKADEQAIADLRNAVTESRQVIGMNTNRGGNNVSMNQGPGNWTGTQSMEGQSGMGPSSVNQGARWGGEQSWMQGGGQFQTSHQQGNIPAWARGGFAGQSSLGSQQGLGGAQQQLGGGWTGTQYGEGQSGYGPSSLSQGARWGGEQSWMQGGGQFQSSYQQGNIPSWARGGFGGQSSFGGQQGLGGAQQPLGGGWTGTQYGEGQSGYGPSSLSQGTRWGGEPSWSTGFGGQFQSGQGVNLPQWARGGFAQQAGQGIGPQGSHLPGSSIQSGNLGWTGTQAGEGQSGYGPSSLGQYGTGSWQRGSSMERQPWQQSGQGNWQSQ